MLTMNTQMGDLILHKNWIFIHSLLPNSSPAPQISLSRKPICGVGLNSSLLGKSLNFGGRTPKTWVANALANREVEALPVSNGIVEEELKFSPTFSEYLKFMESMSSDQRLNSGLDDGGSDSSLKKRENKLVGLEKKESERKFYKTRDKELKDSKGLVKNWKRDDGAERSSRSHSSLKKRENKLVGLEMKESERKFNKTRDKELKDSKGLVKNGKRNDGAQRRSSGWDMVEGVLEKKTSRGSSNYVGESVDNGQFKNKEVRYIAAHSDRLQDSRKSDRDMRRVGEYENLNGKKHRTWHGTYGKLNEAKLSGNGSHLGSQTVGYGDYSKDIHRKPHNPARREFGERENSKFTNDKEMDDYGNNCTRGNGIRKLEEGVNLKSAYEGKKVLYGRHMSNKSDGSDIHYRLQDSWKSDRDARRVDEYENLIGRKDRSRHGSYGKLNEAKLSGNGSHLGSQTVGYGDYSKDIHQKPHNTARREFAERENYKFKDDKKMDDYENNGSFSESQTYSGGNGIRKLEGAVNLKSAYEGKKVLFGRRMSNKSEGSDIHYNNWIREKQSHELARTTSKAFGNFDDIDAEDRAAFKTFELFTDVRNRPRVLRMEMEERIQKLAKHLHAADVNMAEWKFSKIIHSAGIKFSEHSILRVVQVLGELGNWKRALQVVEWLQSHERFKSYKSRYIYTSVLDVLGKSRRPMEALNVFYAMRKELSSYPDLAAYHCIAVTLGQAGLMKELFDVIDCMRETPKKQFKLGPLQKWDPRLEPDLIVYNAVLNACVQQKQWEGAFWVLQQLKQQNIKPSSTTYGLVMEVMLACGKYNLVHEFFKKVQKTSIPSTLNYKVLVNTLWREGKINEAVEAVEDMERRGIVGSASLYYDLARCLCSAGRCQEALSQMEKICKVAKKPLVVTYTGLIQACMDCGNIEDGAYIFSQMLKFCAPNTVTYNIMLKSYIKQGKFEEAKVLFQKLLDSIQINREASSNQKALPDKFTFNTMMEACASTRNWNDFVEVYQQMFHHGYHFDAKRHLHMVMDAFRAGKVEILEITWEHFAHSDRCPPSPIIKERFCMKLEEGKCTDAILCIGVHQDIEMNAFSEKLWLALLKNNVNRFKTETIFRLSEELTKLIAKSGNLNPVYRNLLKACTEFVSDSTTTVNLRYDCQTVLI